MSFAGEILFLILPVQYSTKRWYLKSSSYLVGPEGWVMHQDLFLPISHSTQHVLPPAQHKDRHPQTDGCAMPAGTWAEPQEQSKVTAVLPQHRCDLSNQQQ